MTIPHELESTIDKLLKLLESVGETNWYNALYKLESRYIMATTTEEQRQVCSDILRIYGGMGTFSDLVLYQRGQLLISENELLDSLRGELFNLAKIER